MLGGRLGQKARLGLQGLICLIARGEGRSRGEDGEHGHCGGAHGEDRAVQIQPGILDS